VLSRDLPYAEGWLHTAEQDLQERYVTITTTLSICIAACFELGTGFIWQLPVRSECIVRLDPADLATFTLIANVSIVSLNLSLMLNPVGYYQASTTSICKPNSIIVH
jgi:hypothetical protein